MTIRLGLHRFIAATLLNVWFILALAQPSLYNLDRIQANTWQHTLAWLVGCALSMAVASVLWLARRRGQQPAPAAAAADGTPPPTLTPPQILFAVVRALAVSITVALASG